MGDICCFTAIGPVMIGPSSSHTAGAVRLGRLARAIFGREPKYVEVLLYGSFYKVGEGHGTKQALMAGILNLDVDAEEIPKSFSIATQRGIAFNIDELHGDQLGEGYHENTVKFILKADNEKIAIIGSSIGGGKVIIRDIDNYKNLNITGECETLIVFHENKPGMIRDISSIFAVAGYNIVHITSNTLNGEEYTIIVVQQPIKQQMLEMIKTIKDVRKTISIGRM